MKSTIACRHCGHQNPVGAEFCAQCRTPFTEAVALGDLPTLVANTPPPVIMEHGTRLGGGRYEILQLLGQGGMGAVYKARDHELDRFVAIKLIQPELVNSPGILKRFKQELILARQITHRNVVRIFDIGETDGMKFITMEYIDGGDLKSAIIERGRTPVEVIDIIRQICYALDAAHSEGVIHRDLKPQNIMIDHTGRVVVMDFGIAHSKDRPGMTMTGALMGTPEYMSPEQAKGKKTDVRSDIFALGIIFYEMLTGNLPFKAETHVETMYKRTHERAVPPVDIDGSVPVQANRIVMKCLETDPDKRYQNVKELLHDLELFDPMEKLNVLDRARTRLRRQSKLSARLGAALAIFAVAIILAFLVRDRIPSAPAAHPPLTLLVADFNNRTGDPVFTGTLESMCITALEEAPFVNMYGRGQAQRLLARLENGATGLDEPAARKIAIREGISVIVAGSIARQGTGYQISVQAVDAVTGKLIATKQVVAPSSQLVLANIGRAIAPIRVALGDTTPESAQLSAAETYTAASLEAAHAYALGQESLGVGKQADAIRYYKQAVDLDPNLARAYAGLAVASFNLKDLAQADAYYKKALALVDRMSEREKYRTFGGYYLGVANNFEQGIETLRKLTLLFPGDAAAYTNLSTGYKRIGKMAEAATASKRAVEISPENLLRRYNYSANSLAAGDLTTAAAEADRILQKDNTFVYAYLPLALTSLLRGDVERAAGVYSRLEKVSSLGASMSNLGQADLKMYVGRFQEALEILLRGIQEDEKQKDPYGELAHKYLAAAEIYSVLGRGSEAATAADRAVASNSLDDGIRYLAARIFVEIGQFTRAQQYAKDLEARLQQQPKSLALLITGDTALKQERLSEAIDAYREARKLHDSWLVHFLLGRTYVEAKHFPEALPELDAADKRGSETADLFDSNISSLRYLPPLYYWLGRAQEGLGAAEASRKSYQRYIAIRKDADSFDKLLPEAKRRTGP